MILKLITTIILLILLSFFAGYNLENKSDVNLLVHTFSQVPVFVTIIISFCSGVVFTLPFMLFTRKKKPKEPKAPKVKSVKPEKPSKEVKQKKEPTTEVYEKVEAEEATTGEDNPYNLSDIEGEGK